MTNHIACVVILIHVDIYIYKSVPAINNTRVLSALSFSFPFLFFLRVNNTLFLIMDMPKQPDSSNGLIISEDKEHINGISNKI